MLAAGQRHGVRGGVIICSAGAEQQEHQAGPERQHGCSRRLAAAARVGVRSSADFLAAPHGNLWQRCGLWGLEHGPRDVTDQVWQLRWKTAYGLSRCAGCSMARLSRSSNVGAAPAQPVDLPGQPPRPCPPCPCFSSKSLSCAHRLTAVLARGVAVPGRRRGLSERRPRQNLSCRRYRPRGTPPTPRAPRSSTIAFSNAQDGGHRPAI